MMTPAGNPMWKLGSRFFPKLLGHPEPSLQRRDIPARQWITDRDRQQFCAKGYMVIRKVLPASVTGNAVREIAAFVGADLADNSTWYGGPPQLNGVVPMHHAQSLWDIRQSPDLYQLFTEFFGTPRLMVDINRCIFRPPVRRDLPEVSRGTIHWDADPRAAGTQRCSRTRSNRDELNTQAMPGAC
jgi:hypothetical protein